MTRRGFMFAALARGHRGMARLAGGTFQMGCDPNVLLKEFPRAGAGLREMLLAETPRHQVTIPAFWMDRYEVTNAQFQRFVKARPEWGKGRRAGDYLLDWEGDWFPAGRADFPVAFITWQAAIAFAEWMGKRLPTEAEWEFAARGGRVHTKFPWGNQAPSPRLANYAESGIKGPARVGSYPPNPYGLFDLGGNVWEFCLDNWRPAYPARATVQSEPDIGRMRDTEAERRVIRGGSFAGGAFNMRVTARDSHRASDPAGHVGFRCALTA